MGVLLRLRLLHTFVVFSRIVLKGFHNLRLDYYK